MNFNPAKKIIDRIKEDHIVPESRWKLNWKSYLFWVVWIGTLVLGALFFSLIILNFLDIGPGNEVFRHFGLGKLIFLLVMTAPFLWIGLAILALISGLLAFRKTKRGYRYSVLFTSSIGVLLISILGIGLHLARINERVGRGIPMGFPMYHHLAFPIDERWSRPDEGMLAGEVLELRPELFTLKSFDEGVWEVRYTNDTRMRLREPLSPGLMVGIIGQKSGDAKFEAKFIRRLPPRDFRPDHNMPPPGAWERP